MRTETYTINVYQFDELSDEAKENVREWYDETFHTAEDYEFDCEEQIDSTQLNRGGDIKVAFDYDYGTGYTRIYGELNLYNVISELYYNSWTGENKISPEEQEMISFCFDQDPWGDYMVKIPKDEEANEYIEENVDSCMDNIIELDEEGSLPVFDDKEKQKLYSRENLLNKLADFKGMACDYIQTLNDNLTEYGKDYFYNIDDEEIEEMCEANEYEFTEDGELI